MLQPWRLRIREAEQALRDGRLEDSSQLVGRNDLQQYPPGRRLSLRVAKRMAERAEQRVRDGHSSAGWHDLQTAHKLAGDTKPLQQSRQKMIDQAFEEVRRYLAADDPQAALRRLGQLQRRDVDGPGIRALKHIALRFETAQRLAREGKFAEAREILAQAAHLDDNLPLVKDQMQVYETKLAQVRGWTAKMHRCLAAKKWSKVITLANDLLAIAPRHREAIDARHRAWAEADTRVDRSKPTQKKESPSARRPQHDLQSTHARSRSAEDDTVIKRTPTNRFVLWVDAVGGFLVCLNDEVVFGQAIPGASIEIPILGDLSRRHAKVSRDGGDYLVEPFEPTWINDKLIHSRALLADGVELQLGSGVRFRFRKPHALSATARLDFLSRHRTQPFADGILLMAESCVLGPRTNNHVVCREWSEDVILYRQENDLYCRASDTVEIDGQICDGTGRITSHSRISGGEFALSLEPI